LANDLEPDVAEIRALKIARGLLDGGSITWAASHFSLSEQQISAAWAFVLEKLKQHYSAKDISIDDPDQFIAERFEEVLRLLVDWSDELQRPVPNPQSFLEVDATDPEGKKNGT